jgi:hypothetical protein
MLWPFEFRDCYSRNRETNLLQISPMFNERIHNINCWTMGPEIFKKYPEFYSDIPTIDHIPAVVSGSGFFGMVKVARRSNSGEQQDEDLELVRIQQRRSRLLE